MTPVVSLDVLPADIPAEYAPAMVDACSGALPEGACVMAAHLPESAAPEAVALVLWQGNELLHVSVRVGRGGGQWVARALNFSANDSIRDRWTTVGLTVATLVGETRGLGTPSAPATQPAPPPAGPTAQPEPRRPSSEDDAHHAWRAALGALVEPGWVDGGWQRGGWISGTFASAAWPLQAHARGSFALSGGPSVEERTLTTQWQSLAVGAGVYGNWPQSSLSGSAALELGYRRIEADLDGRKATTHDFPLRLRAGASVPVGDRFGATFGLSIRLPPQSSRGSAEPTLRAAAVALEGFVGVEVRL